MSESTRHKRPVEQRTRGLCPALLCSDHDHDHPSTPFHRGSCRDLPVFIKPHPRYTPDRSPVPHTDLGFVRSRSSRPVLTRVSCVLPSRRGRGEATRAVSLSPPGLTPTATRKHGSLRFDVVLGASAWHGTHQAEETCRLGSLRRAYYQ